jgi:2-polyprenyl-6-methoxyphenol hydroxylase-like FAD-dependent oxidoreductase
MLTEENLAALDASQVDPEVAKKDTGNFLFLNLATLETKFRIPPNDRRRLSRERFRLALLADERINSHVHWGQRLSEITVLEDGQGVRATFRNGEAAIGRMLIGAEGTNSATRRFLVPDSYMNQPLSIKLLGAAVSLTPAQAQPIRDIDPLLFQGCHPDNHHFLWTSILSTPASNGSEGTPEAHYSVQLIMSWPVVDPTDAAIPETNVLRAAEMKRRAAQFHPTLRAAVDAIPEDGSVAVRKIALQDWPCLPWDNRGGTVTLIGDAAHAMTMYRGEAANHGIMDAYLLARALEDVYAGRSAAADALATYEDEMRERTRVAVLWSREACIGAHDYHSLDENSAVLRRRAIRMPKS